MVYVLWVMVSMLLICDFVVVVIVGLNSLVCMVLFCVMIFVMLFRFEC